MKIRTQNSTSELESLKGQLADLQLALKERDQKIHTLNYQLHILQTAKFGRKTERYQDSGQLDLFDELKLEPTAAEDDFITVTVTKKIKQNKTGKKPLPKNLPFIEEVHDLTAEEKECSCGCTMKHIGDDTTERLDILPKLIYRVINVRRKYACKACEQTIKSAKLPEQLIPKGIATPGLISAVIDAKFNRHMPLYRQEDEFKSLGVELSRANLSNWMIKSANELMPLVKLMHDEVINYDIAYADETPLKVLRKKDKPPSSKSYMWLFIGGPPGKQSFIYQYHDSRREKIAFQFFEDFKGYLHADCYQAYVNLDKGDAVTHVACFAHARRYFMDVVKANAKKKGLANKVVEAIKELYKIERTLKERNADSHAIYHERQEKSLPILEALKLWLEEKFFKVPPKSPIAKAISYTLKHWDALTAFLIDGRLEIDNNRAERSIKPFVIGRKNWMFHGNEAGANAGAIIYSLVETCKHHKVDVFSYFKFALANIKQAKTIDDLSKLLPFNINHENLKSMRDIPNLTFIN